MRHKQKLAAKAKPLLTSMPDATNMSEPQVDVFHVGIIVAHSGWMVHAWSVMCTTASAWTLLVFS